MILRFKTRSGSSYILDFNKLRWYREGLGMHSGMPTKELKGPLYERTHPAIGKPFMLTREDESIPKLTRLIVCRTTNVVAIEQL